MRLAWLTDIHLNFLEPHERRRFLESVRAQADAVVLTGDIGEGPSILGLLQEMETVLTRPIYFVLGNHDFYRSTIAQIRGAVAALASASEYLVYLTVGGVVPLTAHTALVGHDGWADARLGDFDGSDILLNDYWLIAELNKWRSLAEPDKPALRAALEALGDEAAGHLERVLTEAAGKFPRVLAATHVPPFREATWYQGRISDDNYLPHFSCRAAGDALRRVMRAHPHVHLQVLCGHTHGDGEAALLDNLHVLTGAATYGAPAIQRVFEVE